MSVMPLIETNLLIRVLDLLKLKFMTGAVLVPWLSQ